MLFEPRGSDHVYQVCLTESIDQFLVVPDYAEWFKWAEAEANNFSMSRILLSWSDVLYPLFDDGVGVDLEELERVQGVLASLVNHPH